jgi:hypothetical protein
MSISSVYVSSTYEDLKLFRSAVASYLRKLNKQVICMEDYVASDTRPINRCLEDVVKSEVYIGIFAHRYGYVPDADNPNSLSITEIEYREALKAGKPALVFLLSDDAPWIPRYMDTSTGEGEGGKAHQTLHNSHPIPGSKEKSAST